IFRLNFSTSAHTDCMVKLLKNNTELGNRLRRRPCQWGRIIRAKPKMASTNQTKTTERSQFKQ
ncbi:hypothetical protein, partial [Photobacterium angustum]|uniref:hypothetical protein n=1 Tax=Photobacterium angustum TaxID=661 RepID=UPI001F1D49A1